MHEVLEVLLQNNLKTYLKHNDIDMTGNLGYSGSDCWYNEGMLCHSKVRLQNTTHKDQKVHLF